MIHDTSFLSRRTHLALQLIRFYDLNFYHTINNRSQDIMHDVYEGAMHYALKLFFKHLIEYQICTEEELEKKFQHLNAQD